MLCFLIDHEFLCSIRTFLFCKAQASVLSSCTNSNLVAYTCHVAVEKRDYHFNQNLGILPTKLT